MQREVIRLTAEIKELYSVFLINIQYKFRVLVYPHIVICFIYIHELIHSF